jgi:predicted transglutaminase-like cysteine proteinase
MGTELKRIFENSRKEGYTIDVGGIKFFHQVSMDGLPQYSHELFLSLDDNRQYDLAGMMYMSMQNAIFARDSCENASSNVPISLCEEARSQVGENVSRAHQAYQKILNDIKMDITAFEGTLHDDPKIHNVMLVDYLVNSRMKYALDMMTDGVERELWRDPQATALSLEGDCDDYAFLKLKLLQDLGIVGKEDAFAMTFETKDGSGHMTLIVADSRGEYFVFENYSVNEDDPENPLYPEAQSIHDYVSKNVSIIYEIYNGYDQFRSEFALDLQEDKPRPVEPDNKKDLTLTP